MRFLANENFPLTSVKYLRNIGYDITSITETARGSKDQEVLTWAREQKRIILTFDRDYGELIYRYKLPAPAGVIYLRFIPNTPLQPAEYILHLLHNKDVILEEKFTVIELVANSIQIRQKLLPK